MANQGRRGHFNLAVVRHVWRYALGFNLVGTFGMLVSGADKLLISKLLPLVELTYYSVAGTATGALQVIYIAAQITLFPRMSACWQQGDQAQMQRLYMLGLRFGVYLCAAPAFVLCFFPSEILGLWTHSAELTLHVSPLLPTLALATLINCAQGTPLNALLASGETRLPLLVNLLSLPAMAGGCYLAIGTFGSPGAAACWLGANFVCFIVYGHACVRRFFAATRRPFLWGLPLGVLAVQAVVGYGCRALLPEQHGTVVTILWLAWTIFAIYLAGGLALKAEERRILLRPIAKLKILLRQCYLLSFH